MAGIFTRKAIASILNDDSLTPEERADHLFSLYGRALDDGYITKNAAQAATDAAVETAKAQAIKDFKLPDVTDSEEYKRLHADFEAYKAKQTARTSAEYANIKPKFFDAVYDRIDRSENAKPIAEQLNEIQKNYEEYFNPVEQPKQTPTPTFVGKTEGAMPTGDGDGSFAKYWGYAKKG